MRSPHGRAQRLGSGGVRGSKRANRTPGLSLMRISYMIMLLFIVRIPNAVLSGEVPIVIINGMAKADPIVDEVALEVRRDR